VLKKLVRSGEVVKDGKLYRLAKPSAPASKGATAPGLVPVWTPGRDAASLSSVGARKAAPAGGI
jgi:hypothetical protein